MAGLDPITGKAQGDAGDAGDGFFSGIGDFFKDTLSDVAKVGVDAAKIRLANEIVGDPVGSTIPESGAPVTADPGLRLQSQGAQRVYYDVTGKPVEDRTGLIASLPLSSNFNPDRPEIAGAAGIAGLNTTTLVLIVALVVAGILITKKK